MIPSRGLRPLGIASTHPRPLISTCSRPTRQFSSIPRSSNPSLPSYRSNPLGPARWRRYDSAAPAIFLSASSVRYGSWYAPWSWGSSKTNPETPLTTTNTAELAQSSPTNAAVTTATPELAPAGIDRPAVTEQLQSKVETRTVEDVLNVDPASPTANALASLDPTSASYWTDVAPTVTYWGQLKDMGLDYGWGSSAFVQSLLELAYLQLELGWVGSIVATTIAIRCILFFGFQIRGSEAGAKMAALKPVLQPLQSEMEQAKLEGNDEKAQMLRMKQQVIMKDVGADIFKTLGTPVAQMVLGFGAFRCLRGMGNLPVPGMTSEQFLWVKDLTTADPTFILPIIIGGMMYGVIRIGGETGTATNASMGAMQKKVQIAIPFFMTIINAFQPAAVQIYFFCSIGLGASTAMMLRNPSFRRFARLSKLPQPADFERLQAGKVATSTAGIGPSFKPHRKVPAMHRASQKTPAGASVRYEAPSSRRANSSQSLPTPAFASGINLKSGVSFPPHMRPVEAADAKKAAAAADEESKAAVDPSLSKSQQLWAQYKPSALATKAARYMSKRDRRSLAERAEHERKIKMRKAKERYELERRRRLDSGR